MWRTVAGLSLIVTLSAPWAVADEARLTDNTAAEPDVTYAPVGGQPSS